MTTRQKSIVSQMVTYLRNNATILIAFIALTWQISYQMGGIVIRHIGDFVLVVNGNSEKIKAINDSFSNYKMRQLFRDENQDASIIQALAKHP
jgi:hypothetical protein